jgi:phosphopantothenoylcysteine decarboxylase/phosphopantothenate--cysteine ligase
MSTAPGDGALSATGPLAGRFVVVGVTGGIAAYKAVELVRGLVDAGAHVAPVLTEAATRFVGLATFSALASEPAVVELFDAGHPIPHTRLGQRADVVVVAPATARCIGEYAAGIAADLLGATLLATQAPVVLCPAMHREMWEHPAVQANLATLRARGVHIVEPTRGRLAGGDVGEGRLAEPADIVAAVNGLLGPATDPDPATDLTGLRVVVSAGGTREPIDPVRYLANRSSGRQGHALAEVAQARGAAVVLVTCAVLPVPSGVVVVAVDTAAELAEAMYAEAATADVIIMAAAVADFRPVVVATRKLKKRDGVPRIELEPTEDVLAGLVARRRPGQTIVGFAAETDDVVAEGAAKLAAKGADLMVVNDVSADQVGFGHETNAVTILGAAGSEIVVPLGPKPRIAAAVLDAVAAIRRAGPRGADA